MLSKYALFGMLIQILCYQIVFAIESKAQDVKSVKEMALVINLEDASLKEIFRQIESTTSFKFNYHKADLDKDLRINYSSKRNSVADLLLHISKESGLGFKQVNNIINVSKANYNQRKEAIEIEVIIQTRTVTGTITADEDGETLPGVNVVEKGTSNGTVTNVDGEYTLTVSEGATLIFSSVGFVSEEIVVGSRSVVDLVMTGDVTQLEELVVVGYGTEKLKNITGAIAKVDLENSPVAAVPTTNVLQSLRGNMAGVNIGTQNAVGENPNLLVRGQNSINGSNDPLIVLDGVIFLGNIADINPADIADISVLKDASAAAAYGSRSANGVIMINTKRGKTDKPTIRYSTTFGLNTWRNKPDLMNREQWANKYAIQRGFESIDEIVMPDASTQLMLEQEDLDNYWPDLVSRNGVTQEHQVSVSGRADRVNYFFSGGVADQEGTIIGDDFKRISARARLDVDVTDWLEVGIDGTYNNNDYSGIGADLSNALVMAPSSAPFIYEDWPNNAASTTSTQLARFPRGQSIPNALWGTDGITAHDVDKNDFFRFAGNALFKVPGIDGLTYRLNYSVYTRVITRERFFFESYYVQENANPPFYLPYTAAEASKGLTQANGYNRDIRQNNYVVDNIINYNKEFGRHYLDATLVATRDYTSTETDELVGRDFSTNGNTTLGLNGLPFAETQINSLDIVERANIGYLARFSYAFMDRYHLNASIRRDGASVFGAENKWGNFPSVGVAWTLSEESFLNGNNLLDYLKINASYGVNGNQGVGPYGTLSRVRSGPSGNVLYEFGDAPSTLLYGIQQQTLATPSLGWERTSSFNGGFQSIWLKNRLFFDLNFYFSQTTDQIFSRQIPIMTGFNTIISSLGQVDNRGFEINLRGNLIEKSDFSWSSSLNLWKNKNELVSLYGDDLDGDGREDDDISNNLFIGESLGAIYGYEFVGVAQETDTEYLTLNGGVPGDPMFNDLDGNGLITAEDRKILGFEDPNFRFGFSNTVSYKNFGLYVMIAGNLGGNGFYQQANPYATSFRDRFDTNELNHPYWTPENKSTKYLQPTYNGSRYLGLESRGFVRIQDIILSYVLPSDLLSGIGVQSLKLNATVRNLHTFTNWSGGGDPEEGVAPLTDTYPVPTVYSLGLNVSF